MRLTRLAAGLMLATSLACADPGRESPSAALHWSSFPAFLAPAESGAVFVDLDADGLQESVLSGRSVVSGFPNPHSTLYTLEEVGGQPQLTSALTLPQSVTFSGQLQRMRRSRAPERLVAALKLASGQIDLVSYGGKPLQEVARVRAPDGFVLQQLADVDRDGDIEALGVDGRGFSPGQGAMQVDLLTGQLQWQRSGRFLHVRAGALDADPGLELVLAPEPGWGLSVQIVDGLTQQVEGSLPDAATGVPLIADFRNDLEPADLAMLQPDGLTRFYGLRTKGVRFLYSLSTGLLQAPLALDVDRDGREDLAGRDAATGRVRAWTRKGDAWTVLFDLPSPDPGSAALAIGRWNGASGPQLLEGVTAPSAGIDVLRLLDLDGGTERWRQTEDAGPHSATLIADLQGDGQDEYIAVSAGDSSGATLVVRDAAGQLLLQRTPALRNRQVPEAVPVLATAQLDSDPQLELVIGGAEFRRGRVRVLDGLDGQEQWLSPQIGPFDAGVSSLALLDFNQDGTQDILAFAASQAHVLNGRTGAVLRSTGFIEEAIIHKSAILVGNLDADAATEIAVQVNTQVVIYSSALFEERRFSLPLFARDLRLENGADGCQLIAIGGARLERIPCTGSTAVSSRTYPEVASYVGFVSDSHGPLVLAANDRVLLDVPGQTTLSSAVLGPLLGYNHRGAVRARVDGVDVLLGTVNGVHRLRFP